MGRTRDREASRQAILDSAEALFLKSGVRGASIGDIAKSAGVTKGLVFYHFTSKEGLVEQVRGRLQERHAHELRARLLQMDDSMESLYTAFTLYFEFHRQNQTATRLMSWDYLEGEPAHAAMADARLAVIEVLRRGQERGELRADVDAEAVVVAGFCMVEHWFEIQESVGERSVTPVTLDHDTFLRTTVAWMRRGLEPEGRPE